MGNIQLKFLGIIALKLTVRSAPATPALATDYPRAATQLTPRQMRFGNRLLTARENVIKVEFKNRVVNE